MSALKWALLTIMIVVAALVLIPWSAHGYEYNETNITEIQAYPTVPFYSSPIMMDVVNGTGSLQLGYVPTYSRVEGMDIIIQQLTAITIILMVIGILIAYYVGLYTWRYVTKS